VLCLVKKVRFFKGLCKSNSKFHVSIGHTTIVANAVFFGLQDLNPLSISGVDAADADANAALSLAGGESGSESENEGATSSNSKKRSSRPSRRESEMGQSTLNATYHRSFPAISFPFEKDFPFQEELHGSDGLIFGKEPVQWALLQFQQPVYCPLGSLVIGSRLDADSHENSDSAHQCRLAFFGPIRDSLKDGEEELLKVRLFTLRTKECRLHKITDSRLAEAEGDVAESEKRVLVLEAIVRGIVSEKGSISPFIGMKVEAQNGSVGTIMSPFGSGGAVQ
jgi:selenocysteine-specific elongation factor